MLNVSLDCSLVVLDVVGGRARGSTIVGEGKYQQPPSTGHATQVGSPAANLVRRPAGICMVQGDIKDQKTKT